MQELVGVQLQGLQLGPNLVSEPFNALLAGGMELLHFDQGQSIVVLFQVRRVGCCRFLKPGHLVLEPGQVDSAVFSLLKPRCLLSLQPQVGAGALMLLKPLERPSCFPAPEGLKSGTPAPSQPPLNPRIILIMSRRRWPAPFYLCLCSLGIACYGAPCFYR